MSFEDSDMYQAILDGDLAALGCSVRELDDLNLRDSSGKSYLHICIELGQHDLVEYLAQRVFLGFRDDHGLTALDLAVRYRMVEVERQLVRRVAGMQDSDDTEGLQALFHAGWRAWPPLRPQEEGQEKPLSPGHRCQLDILQRQKQVDRVHSAVQDGELGQLQAAVARDESLVTVADHTGLPPLHKAVLFEWLSLAQYLSRTFPHTVNHTDHMGRTALHYAAAYNEYQDNILYKQLVRAGAMQAVTDLMGLTPTDIVLHPSLLSIEVMREEVRCRRSRPPKDYSSNMSYEESRSLTGTHTVASTTTRSMRRWRAIASVASFATNTQRKISSKYELRSVLTDAFSVHLRFKPFEETDLYEAIITNDIRHVRHALSQGADVSQHSVEGWSYLHLAVAHHVSPPLMSLLLTQLSPAERDCDGVSPLEMCLRRRQGDRLARVFVDLVVGLVLADDVAALQGLVHDGWQVWPGEDYVARVLQPHVTPRMTQFLDSLQHFMSSVSEAHKAAILHQELDIDLTPLLDTEAGVTCLDSVGLALPHVCVIFYNIQLLTRVLRASPFAANLKDSMGRTPLHYAAGLDDDDYMYSLLRAASARDDQEDLWGMRPGDYMTQRQRIVSPAIQETIRDKLYNPLSLAPSWPYCLLSAKMESSKLYTAIKANDADSVDSLLADPSTDTTLRDLDGRSLLHHAVLLETDLPVVKALAQRVDLALRDHEGNTVLDLINAGSEPEAKRKVVEDRVREVVLAGEEGQKVAHGMLLAGWFHWPVTPQEAKEKSEQAAELLGKIMGFKDKIEAVHKALQERRVSDLAQLLQADKELAGSADTTGLSPLHKAVLFQQVELVQALITEFKEALNAKDYMGRTALHYAAALKDDGVLYNRLKDAGADEAAADLVGKSPKDYQQDPDNLPLGDLTARVEKLVGKPAPLETPKAQAAEEPAAPVKQPTPPPPEPPKPVQVKPVEMYIPKPDNQRLPPPSTIDGKYVAQHLGTALTQALAEIVEKKPWDPIEYLGQWLYKYRHTLDEAAQRKKLLEEIRSEEEVANGEEVIKLKRKEEEMRIQEEEERKRQEEEAARKKKEQEDLQRQAKEAILSQKPLLPTVTEEEDEDPTFRKRNGKGQTELHTLAAQSGADLVALVNLGYSLADRDAENRTPRDVAEENDLTENVEAIDNYVTNLIEHENIDALKQMILEGYDKLDAVLQQVSTDGLSENLTDFVKSIPNEQQKVSAIFQAVASGKLSEVENSMDRSLALAKDQYGRSPLHLAVLAGHKDIAQYIVKHFRTSARTRDNLNRTPLHYAAALSEELSELLKANGADTNAKDFKQRTPAHYEADKEEILALKKTLPVSSDSKVTSATVPEIKADDDSSPDDADDKDKD